MSVSFEVVPWLVAVVPVAFLLGWLIRGSR